MNHEACGCCHCRQGMPPVSRMCCKRCSKALACEDMRTGRLMHQLIDGACDRPGDLQTNLQHVGQELGLKVSRL